MSEPTEIVIKVDHVSKNFVLPHERANSIKSLFTHVAKKRAKKVETQHALKDISLEIHKGEFFGIVGRNGSGKSTMLKILAGIYQPTKGKVFTKGKLVPFIELGVGFNPELTGRENVYLNGAMLGFSESEVSAMYDDIVEFAELERFMDQKLKNYSSGMQVRLAFSMATRSEADILLIDEVLAVGDADFQRKCFKYFKQLKRQKKTVVFVSHDMDAVREYCDNAVLIEQSKIVMTGSSEKVSQEYTKLFMQPSEQPQDEQASEETTRWGSGALVTTRATAVANTEKVVIHADLLARNGVDKSIYGLHISSSDGKDVTAANNRMLKVPDLASMTAGQAAELEWEVLNVFSDGTYSVTITLVTPAGDVLDWYSDAASFEIRKEKRSTTAILPPIEVKSTIKS